MVGDDNLRGHGSDELYGGPGYDSIEPDDGNDFVDGAPMG